MIEIVVITHGNLASELVRIISKITDKPARAVPVCLDLNQDHTEYSEIITGVFDKLDASNPVIVLTDMFGGTPSNISFPFVQKDMVEVITGLNLPMLMYLETQCDDKDFTELCEGAKKAGQDAIIIAGQFMS